MGKWTTADIPDQTGRTAVITGANTGLGYETASALAAKGAHVVLAVRNLEKGKSRGRRRIARATTWRQRGDPRARPDLARTPSGPPPTSFAPAHDSIDLLINNAGVMMTPKSTTKDGFELQFGTNHLGPLRADEPAARPRALARAGFANRDRQQRRSSFRPRQSASDDLQWERDYGRIRAYGQSKLANLMLHV